MCYVVWFVYVGYDDVVCVVEYYFDCVCKVGGYLGFEIEDGLCFDVEGLLC